MGFQRTLSSGAQIGWADGQIATVTAVEQWDEATVVTVVGPRLERGKEQELLEWTLVDGPATA